MGLLPDGTVVPSFLSLDYGNETDSDSAFGNVSLQLGEVQKIYYPDDPNNLSKQFIEYEVYVQELVNGIRNWRTYQHCIVASLFGGLADKFVYTLRPSDSAAKSEIQLNSKVLLLCISGETTNAMIISGIRAPQDDSEKEKTADDNDGHHLDFEFNGIEANINDDGEFALTYKGKTKNDGTLDDNVAKAAVGTTQTFSKDGSWQVNTVADNSEEQSIQIDHTNKNINITAKNNINLKSEDGTVIGQGTDALILGTTYRNAEQSLNNTLAGNFKALTGLITTAAAACTQAAAIAPPLAAAGIALGTAAGLLQAMSQAILSFEQGQYLSTKNSSD